MEQVKNLWGKVVNHVVENKELYIRVGLTLAGAVVGATVASVASNMQNDYLIEEITSSVEEVA